MSVLIKGMKMPINCFLCPLSVLNGERLFCEITKDEVLRAKIAPGCPIVEIPPHGDLIDRDSLLAEYERDERAADEHGREFSFSFDSGGARCTEWWIVQQKLMDAPVIIPADKEGSA